MEILSDAEGYRRWRGDNTWKIVVDPTARWWNPCRYQVWRPHGETDGLPHYGYAMTLRGARRILRNAMQGKVHKPLKHWQYPVIEEHEQ